MAGSQEKTLHGRRCTLRILRLPCLLLARKEVVMLLREAAVCFLKRSLCTIGVPAFAVLPPDGARDGFLTVREDGKCTAESEGGLHAPVNGGGVAAVSIQISPCKAQKCMCRTSSRQVR